MSTLPGRGAPERAGASGIGGWLLLPAASLVLFPVRFASASSESLGGLFQGVAGRLSPEQLAFLRRAVAVHAALSIAIVLGGAALLVVLLRRRRSVPHLVLRYYGLVALAGLFEWLSARRAAELGVELPGFGAAWFVAAVATIAAGGSYLALSRRVRATFVN